MKLPVILTPGEDGWIIAECPVLPGCISQGKTKEEVLDNIREAAELWLEEEPAGFEISAEYTEIEVHPRCRSHLAPDNQSAGIALPTGLFDFALTLVVDF